MPLNRMDHPRLSNLLAYPTTHYRTTPLPYTPPKDIHMTTSTNQHEVTMDISSLPTTEYLYARDSSLRDSKHHLSHALSKGLRGYAYKRSSTERVLRPCV